MPKRPVQHEIADQGVAEVVRILADAGWACERAQSDYGEDLICQTSHDGVVDPHRILVQVKSTRRKIGGRGTSIAVKRGTLLKWLSDSNIVIVATWSAANKAAYFAFPSDQVNLSDAENSQQRVILHISSEHLLTERAAREIAWKARLRNVNRHFLETKTTLSYLHPGHFDTRKEYEKISEELKMEMTLIVVRFLVYLGLLKRSGKVFFVDTHAFIEGMMFFGSVVKNKEGLAKLKFDFDQTVFLVILLIAAKRIPGVGVPPALLEEAHRFYSTHLTDLIRENYSKMGKRMSKARIMKVLAGLAERLSLFGAEIPAEDLPKFGEMVFRVLDKEP